MYIKLMGEGREMNREKYSTLYENKGAIKLIYTAQ